MNFVIFGINAEIIFNAEFPSKLCNRPLTFRRPLFFFFLLPYDRYTIRTYYLTHKSYERTEAVQVRTIDSSCCAVANLRRRVVQGSTTRKTRRRKFVLLLTLYSVDGSVDYVDSKSESCENEAAGRFVGEESKNRIRCFVTGTQPYRCQPKRRRSQRRNHRKSSIGGRYWPTLTTKIQQRDMDIMFAAYQRFATYGCSVMPPRYVPLANT